MDPEPVDQQPTTGLSNGNPYVGPRAFTEVEARRFYGREREARDLLALIMRERLVLFYAQSGAGKSSLINARLVPLLREQGFDVLPVGRVSGEASADIGLGNHNLFTGNLMLSLNRGLPTAQQADGDALRSVDLLSFLAGADADATDLAPTVLIVDQFEEIVTTHPERWRDRRRFFEQLRDATEQLPNLWVVLTLREDYVAPLEPYAELLPNRLRARYYMQRLGVDAALEAIAQPAASTGRPFAEGVAELLVENLRLVRVPGESTPQPGPYVEPVQLQVVCYQLWERVQSREPGPITRADLPLDYIDQALSRFYEDALSNVLADTSVQQAGVGERALRTWFSEEMVTETGIRNMVLRNEETQRTGSLPNVAVDLLARWYLLRMELRAGGTWVELVHDRFVEPLLRANQAWFERHRHPLTLAAQAWMSTGKPPDKLYQGELLREAQTVVQASLDDFGPLEREFVSAGHEAARRREVKRLRSTVLVVAALLILFAGLTGWSVISAVREARAESTAAAAATHAAADRARALIAERTAAAQRDLAVQAESTAASERDLAVQAQSTAVAERDKAATAETSLRAQRDSVAALASNLESLLTLQASREGTPPSPNGTPTATRRPGGTPARPTPTPPPTPTTDRAATATVRAIEVQLVKVQATQTADARATGTAVAQATHVASCPFEPEGEFKELWMRGVSDGAGLSRAPDADRRSLCRTALRTGRYVLERV